MTVKINADTSDGLKIVSDTSGEIDLQSNGSTKVSFDTSGNMTTPGTIPSSALTGALPAIDGSALTGLAGGTIVKIACDEVSAEVSGSGAFSNLGLEVSIAMASTSNKILLLATGSLATLGTAFAMRFTENNTPVGLGDSPTSNTNRPRVSFKGMSSNGNRTANFAGSCILSPNSTANSTYRVQVEVESQGTWYLNRAWHASNSSDVSHGVSSSYFYAIELDGNNTTIST